MSVTSLAPQASVSAIPPQTHVIDQVWAGTDEQVLRSHFRGAYGLPSPFVPREGFEPSSRVSKTQSCSCIQGEMVAASPARFEPLRVLPDRVQAVRACDPGSLGGSRTHTPLRALVSKTSAAAITPRGRDFHLVLPTGFEPASS